jgi:hypothetical protein
MASEGLRGASEGWARGVARERASAPPASALVAKRPGSLRVGSPAGHFPSTGNVTKSCRFAYTPYIPYTPYA